MPITKYWLKTRNACSEGIQWFIDYIKDDVSVETLALTLIATDEKQKLQWCNWLLVRVFTREQKLKYAIFAAEQVIDIYEKKYSINKKPREAIEAAKKVLENDTPENRESAARAADATYAAAYATYDAADAAYAAAAAAAYAAYDAADVAYDAADAAYAAVNAAAYAAADAYKTFLIRILEYGISLVKED